MPELPEVETVRRGLETVVRGRRIAEVWILRDRTVRRQAQGGHWLADTLRGASITAVARRGKYLWWELADNPIPALIAHLGMSGQFRTLSEQQAASPTANFGGHERVRFRFDDGSGLAFADQRTFGWLLGSEALTAGIPRELGHVALDPLDPGFDAAVAVQRIRGRRSGIKRVLLDQTVVSGIGNIYADEALWRARLHFAHDASRLPERRVLGLLEQVDDVLTEALAQGGTSFDPLYVDVNGSSGWFARHLNVYGQEDHPCPRCGRAIVRERFTNRSSYRCPACQRRPAVPRW